MIIVLLHPYFAWQNYGFQNDCLLPIIGVPRENTSMSQERKGASVRIHDLVKRFGEVLAVDEISLEIQLGIETGGTARIRPLSPKTTQRRAAIEGCYPYSPRV
jgi:hypothetical protein